jgi:hypothetical protein
MAGARSDAERRLPVAAGDHRPAEVQAHISKFDEAQCLDLIERINLAEAVRLAAEQPAEVSA